MKIIYGYVLNFFVFSEKVEKAKESDINVEEATSKDKEVYLKIFQTPQVQSEHSGVRESILTNKKNAHNYWKYNINKKYIQYKIHMIYWKGKAVGYINFFPDASNGEIVYIAYSIDPKYWNNGICTLAVKKLIGKYKIQLKSMGIKKICATVKINNFGSIRVLEKNGFIIKEDILCNDFPAKLLELNI